VPACWRQLAHGSMLVTACSRRLVGDGWFVRNARAIDAKSLEARRPFTVMKRFWKWVMTLALIGGTPSFYGRASEARGPDVAVDPYAFFVGRVTRSFLDDLHGEALQDEASLHRPSPHETSSHAASLYDATAHR